MFNIIDYSEYHVLVTAHRLICKHPFKVDLFKYIVCWPVQFIDFSLQAQALRSGPDVGEVLGLISQRDLSLVSYHFVLHLSPKTDLSLFVKSPRNYTSSAKKSFMLNNRRCVIFFVVFRPAKRMKMKHLIVLLIDY